MTNILCGRNTSENILDALGYCSFTVTDSNIASLYPQLTKDAYVIQAGENSKDPNTLLAILKEMSDRGIKRGDRIAAVGGGVVGDITGFAAAVYMRGIEWTSIPTSLLAMVDSGIGGKTAVDFNGIKNLIGAFHEPVNAIISTHFLKTLPDREWLCGIGELIKTCLLTDNSFNKLKSDIDVLLGKNVDRIFGLVDECVKIKNAVVRSDPTEKGLRKILNIGHTVGHALESLDGYKLSHGEYVLKGMMTEFAMCKDLIDGQFYDEVMSVISKLTDPPKSTCKSVYEKAKSDKKNVGNTISVVIPVCSSRTAEVSLEYGDFIQRYDSALKELKNERNRR